MKYAVHICRFDSTEHLRGKKRTYAAVREAVLKAGRFSVFEATASDQNARMFTSIENDPTLEVRRDFGFPWIGPITEKSKVEA